MINELMTDAFKDSTILVVIPVALSVAWYVLGMLSIDPPFMGWVLAAAGLVLVEVMDIEQFRVRVDTLVLGFRILINFVVALIGIAISGIAVFIAGPPPPKGPFSVFLSVTAFMAIIAVFRTFQRVMILASRFDWHAIREWWNSRKGEDGSPRRFIDLNLPMEN